MRHHHDHAARPLRAGGAAARAAEAAAGSAGGEVGLLARPQARERAHVACAGTPVSGSCHSGVLGTPSSIAHHVGAPLLEAGGALRPRTRWSYRSSLIHTYMIAIASAASVPGRIGIQRPPNSCAVGLQCGSMWMNSMPSSLRPQAPLRCPRSPCSRRRCSPGRSTRTRSARPSAGSPRWCRSCRRRPPAGCVPSDASRPSTSLPSCPGWRPCA